MGHRIARLGATGGRPRRGAAAAGALLVVLSVGPLSACTSASPPSPPTGVDGLVIPTPSPDPKDFVQVIDNQWLPLRVGAVWLYDATGATPADSVNQRGSQRVQVVTGRKISGVATTGVRTVLTRPGQLSVETLDFYAQDQAGNVWWFGRDKVWAAGEDGAEAGLAMAASPRLGDGYLKSATSGGSDERAEVVDMDDDRDVPLAGYDELLVVETTPSAADDPALRDYFARDVGLVASESIEGPKLQLGLAAYDEPQ